MPNYKLSYDYRVAKNIDTNQSFLIGCGNREDRIYQQWLAAGNTPQPPDPLPPLGEAAQAKAGVRQWIIDHPVALDFMRLPPDEQKTAIDAMATAALKTVIWYLVVVVSALVKERYL